MNRKTKTLPNPVTLKRDDIQSLFDVLSESGYKIVGPTVKNQAIVIDEIESPEQLPEGYQDTQAPGLYRLNKTEHAGLFQYATGSQSPKRWFFPARRELWQAKKDNGCFKLVKPGNGDQPQPLAMIGVRPCELKALSMHDKIFSQGDHVDPHYKYLRQQSFIVAVNCTNPGGTCFCVSMKAGPEATEGYDLVMTEVVDKDKHFFVIKSGSESGNEVLVSLPTKPSTPEQITQAEQLITKARANMGREVALDGLKERIEEEFDSIHWNDIADRCLSCGNCTLVCPTCFCSDVIDQSDLTVTTVKRVRQWDSCFTVNFSYIHGGSLRNSVQSRYRQWLSHKFAYWHDQFQTAGCVGCGRCITWCPVGIDITEEVRALTRKDEPAVVS